jgi:hypothetical protein
MNSFERIAWIIVETFHLGLGPAAKRKTVIQYLCRGHSSDIPPR